MARYGKAFKDRAVARLLPPESTSVEEVSRQIGVSASTLERWRADALGNDQAGGAWTASARFQAVLTTAGMSQADASAWCRSQGVHASELAQWRETAQGALEAPCVTPGNAMDRRRVKELERELRRKDKALAEAAALLVLSKKLEALYPRDADA